MDKEQYNQTVKRKHTGVCKYKKAKTWLFTWKQISQNKKKQRDKQEIIYFK